MRSWLARRLESFEPYQSVPTIFDIDYRGLRAVGVTAIVFDLENTLVPYRAEGLSARTLDLLEDLRREGLALGIVSNSTRSWVHAVATPLGIPYVGKAGKPRERAFRAVLDGLDVPLENTIVVGDQLLTDVYGAQRLGLRAVLVGPLGQEEPWTSKLQRFFVPKALRAARWLARSGARTIG